MNDHDNEDWFDFIPYEQLSQDVKREILDVDEQYHRDDEDESLLEGIYFRLKITDYYNVQFYVQVLRYYLEVVPRDIEKNNKNKQKNVLGGRYSEKERSRSRSRSRSRNSQDSYTNIRIWNRNNLPILKYLMKLWCSNKNQYSFLQPSNDVDNCFLGEDAITCNYLIHFYVSQQLPLLALEQYRYRCTNPTLSVSTFHYLWSSIPLKIKESIVYYKEIFNRCLHTYNVDVLDFYRQHRILSVEQMVASIEETDFVKELGLTRLKVVVEEKENGRKKGEEEEEGDEEEIAIINMCAFLDRVGWVRTEEWQCSRILQEKHYYKTLLYFVDEKRMGDVDDERAKGGKKKQWSSENMLDLLLRNVSTTIFNKDKNISKNKYFCSLIDHLSDRLNSLDDSRSHDGHYWLQLLYSQQIHWRNEFKNDIYKRFLTIIKANVSLSSSSKDININTNRESMVYPWIVDRLNDDYPLEPLYIIDPLDPLYNIYERRTHEWDHPSLVQEVLNFIGIPNELKESEQVDAGGGTENEKDEKSLKRGSKKKSGKKGKNKNKNKNSTKTTTSGKKGDKNKSGEGGEGDRKNRIENDKNEVVLNVQTGVDTFEMLVLTRKQQERFLFTWKEYDKTDDKNNRVSLEGGGGEEGEGEDDENIQVIALYDILFPHWNFTLSLHEVVRVVKLFLLNGTSFSLKSYPFSFDRSFHIEPSSDEKEKEKENDLRDKKNKGWQELLHMKDDGLPFFILVMNYMGFRSLAQLGCAALAYRHYLHKQQIVVRKTQNMDK